MRHEARTISKHRWEDLQNDLVGDGIFYYVSSQRDNFKCALSCQVSFFCFNSAFFCFLFLFLVFTTIYKTPNDPVIETFIADGGQVLNFGSSY